MKTVCLLAIALFSSILTDSVRAQEAAQSIVAAVRVGECGDAPGELAAPLIGPTVPAGEPVGSDEARTAAMSFTTVPLPLDVLLADSYVIALSRSEDNAPLACGEVGGVFSDNGSLAFALSERDGSGLSGFAYLVPNAADSTQTDVTLLLDPTRGAALPAAEAVAEHPDDSIAAATSAAPTSREQPGGVTAIGTSRADVYAVRGEPAATDVQDFGEFAAESVNYVDAWIYFRLAADGTPRREDPLFIVHAYPEPGASWTLDEASAVAIALLPSDAVPKGVLDRKKHDGKLVEYRRRYHSDSLARLLPDAELYAGKQPGTVWVVLDPTDDRTDDPTEINHVQVTTLLD